MNKVTEVLSYVHFHGAPVKGKILMVASSPSTSQQTGWPIGFWAAELTHPLRVFQEAGYEVELISTEGGKLMMDGYSNPTDPSGYSAHDVISLGYMQQEWFNNMLNNTQKITDVNPDDYVGIFLVGGQGPMYTFRGKPVPFGGALSITAAFLPAKLSPTPTAPTAKPTPNASTPTSRKWCTAKLRSRTRYACTCAAKTRLRHLHICCPKQK